MQIFFSVRGSVENEKVKLPKRAALTNTAHKIHRSHVFWPLFLLA